MADRGQRLDARSPGGELAPARMGFLALVRERLFDGPLNVVLTVLSAAVLVSLLWPAARFLLIDAVWTGSSRSDCLPEAAGRQVGACWPFIRAKLDQLLYGFYPQGERWRVDLTYAIALSLLVPLLIPAAAEKTDARAG